MQNTSTSNEDSKAVQYVMNADWRAHFGACCLLFEDGKKELSGSYRGARGVKSFCETLLEAKELAAQPQNSQLAKALGGWERQVWDRMQSEQTSNRMLFLALFHTEEVLELAQWSEDNNKPFSPQTLFDGINTAV